MGRCEDVQRPARLVIGINCRTSNAKEAGPQDIPKLWERFYSEDIISRIPNKISNEVIALYCDYESDHSQAYTVVIGCPVSSIDTVPQGMVAKTIPPSFYAVFRAIGDHPKALIETWGKIWHEPDLERTYSGDYESYNEKFFSNSPQEIDVYVAIQKSTPFARANKLKFNAIKSLHLPIDQYAITGSGALGIRNLKGIGDIDIIVTAELWDMLAIKHGITDENNVKKIVFPNGIVEAFGEQSFHDEKQERNTPSIKDRIASAEIIEELPFESLEHVLYYKRKMNREKDKQDIEIIEALMNENDSIKNRTFNPSTLV